MNCRLLSAVDVVSCPLKRMLSGFAFVRMGVYPFRFFSHKKWLSFFVVFFIGIQLLPYASLAQTQGGMISRSQCGVSGGVLANLTTVRDAVDMGFGFYWESATNSLFTTGLISNLSPNTQNFTIGTHTSDTYYRRVVPTGLAPPNDFYYSNTIKISIVGAGLINSPVFVPTGVSPICEGNLSFTVSFTLLGSPTPNRYSIIWDQTPSTLGFPDVIEQNLPAGSSLTVNVTATAPAGTYSGTLIPLDANGCSIAGTHAGFTFNPRPTVNITNPAAICAPGVIDLTSVSITSVGSTANLSYTQWNNALATSSLTNASSITASGVYYIKGTIAATGCSVTQPVTATVNSLPTVNITNPAAICAPGVIDLTSVSITSVGSTANLSYTQWNNALATSSLTNASSITASGVYYIKGTIAATGCSVTQPVTATVNSLPTVNITNPAAICAPGVIDLTSVSITSVGSTANLSYTQWNNALATSSLTNASSITASGVYYIKGTIAATGCSVTQPVTATVNSLPTVNITNPAAICAPGVIDLTSVSITSVGSTANLSYTQWNNALATSSLTNASSITASGVYYIKGTIAATGCSVTQPVTATVNSLPTVNITNPAAICAPGVIDLTSVSITSVGSTANLSYTQWNNALATSSLTNASSITASGVYYIKGTIAATGCSVTRPVSATINPLPTVIITNPTAVCTPLTIDLTSTNITSVGSTANLSYTQWNNALATSSLTNASSITASGVYYIKGTIAATGCSVTQPVTATVNSLPTVNITNPAAICAPGVIDLTSVSITSVGSTANLSYTQWNNALATSSLTNASSITASGVYYIKGTIAATGCSVTRPVSATINPLPTVIITNPTAVCTPLTIDLTSTNITSVGSTANLSYTQWNNALATSSLANASSITASGVYYIKGTIAATGCSVTQPVSATINPLPTVIITNPTAVCTPLTIDLTSTNITSIGSTANLSYTQWNNALATSSLANASSITASGVYYIKGTVAVTGCSVTQPVSATINPLPIVNAITGTNTICIGSTTTLTSTTSNGVWSSSSPAIAAISSSGVLTGVSAGTTIISYTVTDVNNCTASVGSSKTVNPLPVMTITNPAAVCVPAVVDITPAFITAGSDPAANLSYWSNAAATALFITPNAVISSGTYYIKGTLPATGCSSIQPVVVTVNPLPTFSIINPAAVCEPATVDITAATVTNGTAAGLTLSYWRDAANTTALTAPGALTSSGTYYIKGVAATGCSISLPISVTVNPLPNGSLQIPSVKFICNGTPFTLTASNAFNYQWYVNQQPIGGATAATYNATAPGNYTVQFSSVGGCKKNSDSTVLLNLLVKPVLRFNASGRCITSSVTFTNTSIAATSGNINWLWDFGDGSSSNNISSSHTYLQGGTYNVSLTANNLSCPAFTDQLTTVHNMEAPVAAVRYDTVLAVNERPFILSAREIGSVYQWRPSTGLSSAIVRTPTATLTADIGYTVSITSSAGCVTTDTVFVKMVNNGVVYVAQGFTPNGDGLNDRAYPILTGVKQLVYFKIFNRWGNLLFQTNNEAPQNGWDGRFQGKMQQPGTYTWMAEVIDGNGNIIHTKGSLLLIN